MRRMRIAYLLVVTTILGAAACKKKEPKADSKAAEPEKEEYVFPKLKAGKTTDGAHDTRCSGDLCDSGTQLPLTSDGALLVKIERCDGCTLEIAGKKIDVEEGKTVKLDLTNALGDADPKSVDGTQDLVLTATVTPPKGSAKNPEQKAELLGSVVAATVFNRVKSGPLAFKKDKDVDKPHAAIIVRSDAKYGVVTRTGEAKHVRDYDLVGIADGTLRDMGTCGVYKKDGTDEKVEVKKQGLTLDVTMYDRRTAKVLGKKTFAPAQPDCSAEYVGGTKTVLGRPPEETMKKWAETFLK